MSGREVQHVTVSGALMCAHTNHIMRETKEYVHLWHHARSEGSSVGSFHLRMHS